VSGTFEAAIADPDIAARLGRLPRAEQWSGFGVLPAVTPDLTLVRGGRDKPRTTEPTKAAPKASAAERRKRERALAAAQRAFDAAEAAFGAAQATERDLTQEVRTLSTKLAKLQGQLDDARAQLERARKDTTSARATRREARSALDRAERDAAE
jgi:hypothetical protein